MHHWLSHFTIPIGPLILVAGAATRIIQRYGFYSEIGFPGSHAPRPTIRADITGTVEIVEIDKLLGDLVEIRCGRFAEQSEGRIAVATIKISQNLIIRPILLHDIDDMLNSLAQLANYNFVLYLRKREKRVIIGYHQRQPECGKEIRYGKTQQP